MNQIPVHITPPKPFKTYPQLVALMQQRGILVEGVARAERKLSQVGYYRLSGFWYPLYGSMPFPGWLKFYNGSS